MNNEPARPFLGFDPGGVGKFGACSAVIAESGEVDFLDVRCVQHAQAAIEWSDEYSDVQAVGIDTLLGWSATGRRACDDLLRTEYPGQSKSVIPQNSLYSAMTLNGMMLAQALAQNGLCLCEAHPKLLLRVHANNDSFRYLVHALEGIAASANTPKQADDMQDALVAAWSASRWYYGKWERDLYRGDMSLIFPAGTATYPWPGSS